MAGAEPPEDVDPDLVPDEPRLVHVVAAVAIGGVLGAEARYGLGLALPHGPDQWPWSTLLINTSGCLLIGVLMVVITEVVRAHPLVRPLLGVGVLGGYTTFSTYAVDVVTLLETGRVVEAVGYFVATPVLAVVAAGVAMRATRRVSAGSGRS